MKHNFANSIKIVLLILVFALAIFWVTSKSRSDQSPVSQTAVSEYQAAQKNATLSDEEKIKVAINAYFTIIYESHKLVKAQDFSPILEDKTLSWVQKEKDKQEIELYIAYRFDLAYQSYKFTLDYDALEIKDNEAVVQLKEGHAVVYKATAPIVSELSGLPHRITLHKLGGSWSIYKDEYEDINTRLLDTESVEQIKKQIDENYNLMMKTEPSYK